MTLRRLGIGAGACAAVLALAWVTIYRPYASSRDELLEEIGEVTSTFDRMDGALEQQDALDERLDWFSNRSLGADIETVDHELRTRLNRLAEANGFDGASVGTGGPSVKRSPARGSMRRSGAWSKLRERIDLVEVDGWVTVEGSLEQVMRLAHAIATEPWLKRLDGFSIEPRDNGETFGATLRLTTLFLPGRAPDPNAEIEPQDADLDGLLAWVATNPFRVPPPEEAVVAAPPRNDKPPRDPKPPKFPYGQWLMTGVAAGPTGPEIWLRNTTSGESRVLALGDTIDRVQLVNAAGERALFETGDEKFHVVVGDSLGDRHPVED